MQQKLHSLPKQYNRIRRFQRPNSSGRNVKSKGEKRTYNISKILYLKLHQYICAFVIFLQ